MAVFRVERNAGYTACPVCSVKHSDFVIHAPVQRIVAEIEKPAVTGFPFSGSGSE